MKKVMLAMAMCLLGCLNQPDNNARMVTVPMSSACVNGNGSYYPTDQPAGFHVFVQGNNKVLEIATLFDADSGGIYLPCDSTYDAYKLEIAY